MRYVIANKEKAMDVGVLLMGHLTKEDLIILNEKDVVCLSSLTGGLDERLPAIDGTIYTNTSINQIISEGGWEYGRKL